MVSIDDVVRRMMEYCKLGSHRQIAEILNISAADFSNRKRRGTLAPKILEWAINENVSLDWLFYGRRISEAEAEGPQFTKVIELLQQMSSEDVSDITRECRRRLDLLFLRNEIASIREKIDGR